MDNIIENKSFHFAVRIVKLCKHLQSGKKEYILSKQLLRAGTSIGANVAESQQAQSRADFISKLSIALKEAVETNYWPLFEVEDGKWILNYKPKNRLPIEDFLKKQGRFKHLFKKENEHLIETYQKEVDRRWEELLRRCEE